MSGDAVPGVDSPVAAHGGVVTLGQLPPRPQLEPKSRISSYPQDQEPRQAVRATSMPDLPNIFSELADDGDESECDTDSLSGSSKDGDSVGEADKPERRTCSSSLASLEDRRTCLTETNAGSTNGNRSQRMKASFDCPSLKTTMLEPRRNSKSSPSESSRRGSKEVAKARAVVANLWDEAFGDSTLGAPAPRLRTQEPNMTQEQIEQRTLAMNRVARMSEKLLQEMKGRLELVRSRSRKRHQTAPSISPVASKEAPSLQVAAAAALANINEDGEVEPMEEQKIVILDWDDTLLPTWYITDVICPCLGKKAAEVVLDEDSPFWVPLVAHAEAVSEVLVKAAEVASVAIVTLAQRPWVETSSNIYLPGSDINALLESLNIKVYYAREHVCAREVRQGKQEEGCDLFVIAKRNAMKKCIKHLCERREANIRRNIISIGDSPTERDAVKEVTWSSDQDILCKTLKLMNDPSVEHLTNELQVMSAYIHKLVLHGEDFDISMADAGDLETLANTVAA